MTEHKLLKYLSKTFEPPEGQRQLVPVVLTDSKGKYLNYQCKTDFENNIKWWYESGRSSSKGLKWLQENIEYKIGHLDNISLYIWLGTCDLTVYKHPYIELNSKPEDCVQTYIDNCQHISECMQNYPGCKLTFLEIPVYSIYEWNKAHKHPDCEKFIKDDTTLLSYVQQINNHIRYINNTLNTRSPCFSSQLLHRNHKEKKKQNRTAQDEYNFQLLKDGIHPKPNLARTWLRMLSHKIKLDCCSIKMGKIKSALENVKTNSEKLLKQIHQLDTVHRSKAYKTAETLRNLTKLARITKGSVQKFEIVLKSEALCGIVQVLDKLDQHCKDLATAQSNMDIPSMETNVQKITDIKTTLPMIVENIERMSTKFPSEEDTPSSSKALHYFNKNKINTEESTCTSTNVSTCSGTSTNSSTSFAGTKNAKEKETSSTTGSLPTSQSDNNDMSDSGDEDIISQSLFDETHHDEAQPHNTSEQPSQSPKSDHEESKTAE